MLGSVASSSLQCTHGARKVLISSGSGGSSSKGPTKGSTKESTKGVTKGSTKGSTKGATKGSTKGATSDTCDWGSILDSDPQSLVDVNSVASDLSSITFQVTQGFSSSMVSGLSVLYGSDDEENTCDVTNDANVDWVSQEYTAYCNACGYAEIKIFLFCGQIPSEGAHCPGDTNSYY
ncbi:MAG: hypothetical protein SGBAC_009527, partial [Bacillariaceae sp.]